MQLTVPTLEEWNTGPYNRIKIATESKSQIDVSNFLGIRQSSISDAKRRLRIPAEWLLTIWEKTGTNPHWIMTGLGLEFLEPTAERGHIVQPLNMPLLYQHQPLNISGGQCNDCPLEDAIMHIQCAVRGALHIKHKLTKDFLCQLFTTEQDAPPETKDDSPGKK